ncbi:hypothetical protein J2T17_007026 [Paenibacillus mucilaginosus]|uniref:vWA domain-containing protein n=1 Tax=Paenibacillus mucilaginosus TaxID=61624 RepID=UPI003D206D84
MQIQSLASVAFGLALPVIVVMYLLKRTYVDTQVPSHLLWNKVLRNLEANRPWQKLRKHLLLFLQLLAAAMLVFALMEPVAWLPGGVSRHVVILMDRSGSMASLINTPSGEAEPVTRLDQAKRQAAELIRAGGHGSMVTLMAVGGEPEVLLTKESDTDKTIKVLESIQPFYGAASYKETMSLAAALTRDESETEIRIFTDKQWTETAEGLSFTVPIQVVPAAEGERNISIRGFGVKAADEKLNAIASVENLGTSDEEAKLTLYSGSTVLGEQTVRLAPGERKSVVFDGFPRAEYYKLSIEHPPDVLSADNQAFAFLSGNQHKRVLLMGDGNLFLEKALMISRAEVVKLNASGSPDTQEMDGAFIPPQGEYDLVILDGVDPSRLNSEPWRQFLAEKPLWLIGAGMSGQEREITKSEYHINRHPVTQYIRLVDTHITKATVPAAAPWEEVLADAGGVPLIAAGYENGHPRLYFTFDLQQSDLPLRTEFPILVQQALEWLGSREAASLGRVIVGEKVDIALSGRTAAAEWIPIDVDGGQALPLSAEKETAGALSPQQSVPSLPGLYAFQETDEGGSKKKTFVEVIMDTRESSITERMDLQFTGRSAQSPSEGIQDESGPSAGPESESSGQRSHSLIPWLLGALLLLIWAEWEVYRRGHSVS